MPDGVTLLDDPEAVLATVTFQAREEEPVEAAEGEDVEAEGEGPEPADDGEPASEG